MSTKTSPKHPRNVREICPKYPRNIPEISLEHPRNIPETSPNVNIASQKINIAAAGYYMGPKITRGEPMFYSRGSSIYSRETKQNHIILEAGRGATAPLHPP